MDPLLQEIIDTHKIKKALTRYPRGLDRIDIDLINSVYHEDAIDMHGIFNGLASDFAKRAVEKQRDELCTSHMLGQSDIEFDGDTAYVETYFFANHLREVEERDNEPHILFMSGRYIDRFEKKNEEWLIAERKVLQDWVHFAKLDTGGYDLDKIFHRPKQSKEDYSYVGRKA